MNWLLNKNIYLVLISVLTIFSCKKGGELGDEIQPEAEVLKTYFDTLRLKTSIVYYDSVFTNVSNRILVGTHQDPLFGKIKITPYIVFGKSAVLNNWGPDPIFDSVTLTIRIQLNTVSSGLVYYYKNGTSANIGFDVHELTQAIDYDSLYTGQKSYTYESAPLTSIDFSDSVLTYTKRISDDFGKRFINSPESFSTDAEFEKLFKGFVFIPKSNTDNIVSIYSVNITLHYHNLFAFNNYVSKNIYSIDAVFPADGKTSIANIEVDRSGTEIANLRNRYDSVPVPFSSGLKCMIQNNTGVMTRVEFPQITSFINSIKGKILINRAELVISPDSSYSMGYQYPNLLYAYKQTSDNRVLKDIKGNPQYLQNNLSNVFYNSSINYAQYSSQEKAYTFDITTYLQAIIDGKLENNGLIIGAENDLLTSTNGQRFIYSSLKRIVFSNSLNPNSDYIRLKVYYTPYQ